MPLAKDNYLLGKFDLVGIKPVSKAMAQIQVTFEMDDDYELTVTATEMNFEEENYQPPFNEVSITIIK